VDKLTTHFVVALNRRLQSEIYTTEDSIRYTFFASLLDVSNLLPEDIILEYPHPKINRGKIDTWIPYFKGEALALEFKYDRAIPSKRNSPRTTKVGKIFNDLRRLEMLDCKGLFVYVTDSEMMGYLRNKTNDFHHFFDLPVGQSWSLTDEFMHRRNKTFLVSSGNMMEMDVKCLVSKEMPKNHYLKIYETISR